MHTWLISALGLWAAYWAAIFAELAHLREREDGVGAVACARIAGSLLAAGLGLFLLGRV
ncbi:hypothetical protein BHAOGJBA_1573 [Methylobacterium hispanicum]|uniref:Uncharacterized protein n=2 Tax=Methylobacteriaceae TaxID=119045 RepID=A0AAV4ZIP0_9HYPH|nr:hypothetical protein BHAOGJBA_1573 [Methylobacterium hispanicum]